ncbi:hypothetical protein TRFO_22803 [Tritrichomonas foetus]|uniref:UBA domain-containing protein n=1 Tax=Tritrichomonas foetus TaxID=1144522 RepID=A0A1J4KB22_9EUKA|nr:hypothetical protein TRFO_22803 [Tritrichomonas foetus]|eukprot:OHT08617.1 hypothetical protein TRFO_22803 [Tritrichomonas foetus]
MVIECFFFFNEWHEIFSIKKCQILSQFQAIKFCLFRRMNPNNFGLPSSLNAHTPFSSIEQSSIQEGNNSNQQIPPNGMFGPPGNGIPQTNNSMTPIVDSSNRFAPTQLDNNFPQNPQFPNQPMNLSSPILPQNPQNSPQSNNTPFQGPLPGNSFEPPPVSHNTFGPPPPASSSPFGGPQPQFQSQPQPFESPSTPPPGFGPPPSSTPNLHQSSGFPHQTSISNNSFNPVGHLNTQSSNPSNSFAPPPASPFGPPGAHPPFPSQDGFQGNRFPQSSTFGPPSNMNINPPFGPPSTSPPFGPPSNSRTPPPFGPPQSSTQGNSFGQPTSNQPPFGQPSFTHPPFGQPPSNSPSFSSSTRNTEGEFTPFAPNAIPPPPSQYSSSPPSSANPSMQEGTSQWETAVSTVVEMGFTRQQVEEALRRTHGNTEIAITFLIEGEDAIPQNHPSPRDIEEIRKMVIENPETIFIILKNLEEHNPQLNVRNNPELLLHLLNIDPTEIDLSRISKQFQLSQTPGLPSIDGDRYIPGIFDRPNQLGQLGEQYQGNLPPGYGTDNEYENIFQSIMGNFSVPEQSDVRRLIEQFPDMDKVELVQVYHSCDRDIEQARELLKTLC